MILRRKRTSTENLCRDLPAEFGAYFDHIRSIDFGQTPAYAYLRRVFRNLSRERTLIMTTCLIGRF